MDGDSRRTQNRRGTSTKAASQGGSGRVRLPRMLLKLSGEALGGPSGVGLDATVLARTAAAVAEVAASGTDVAVVAGGGNLVRGAELAAAGLDRITGDHMGMLATVMNALAFRDALVRAGRAARVLSAHVIAGIVAGYSIEAARASLAKGEILVLAGGTGNPLFTTDTAACLRAIEVGAHAVVKATKVDGVYSADPEEDVRARRLPELTYRDVLDRRLRVMDLTAITLCEEHDLPIIVCDVGEPGALTRVARGDKVGTRIHAGRLSA